MYEFYEKLLKERGLTSYQVAKDTGISQTTLSAWKTRNNALRMDKLQIIADYLGVTVDYLMTGEKTMKELAAAYAKEFECTLEERKLLDAYNKSDDLTQQMILRLLGLEQDSDSKSLKEA